MRLSLLELQVLVALNEQKTLTQIGRELFLRHSSVSRALHMAEEKTGVPLIERVGRRLRLTSAGAELAADARELLAHFDRLDRSVEDLRAGEAGNVRVLATRTACSYILPPVLQRFLATFSRATISVHVASPGEVWQRFAAERYDLAVAPTSSGIPADAQCLFADEDALFVHPADPLARGSDASPLHIPILIAPIEREPERHVDARLKQHHVTYGRRLDIRSLEAAKQLVEAGAGAGLFGRATVQRELADGRMVELSWVRLGMTTAWCVCQRQARRPSAQVQFLLDLLRKQTAAG